jgi:hypothetical protein
MRVKRRHWHLAVALAASGAAALVLVYPWYDRPPADLLQGARAALDSAAASGAPAYAEPFYRSADDLLGRGWSEMGRQRGRLRVLRDYGRADSLLKRSILQADLARVASQDSLRFLDSLAAGELSALEEELGYYRAVLDENLRDPAVERLWSLSQTRLAAAEALVGQGEREAALDMLALAGESLDAAGDALARYLDDEGRMQAIWSKWARETLDESRRSKGVAVIVDKSAHKAYLARAGTVIHAYDCELGRRPGDQKRHAGDGATPEGMYRVVKARSTGSKYYKALLIDYPNGDDRRRFSEDVNSSALPEDARIGGNIEIHGDGGQGRDWTDGCVALTNADMDHLMGYAYVGMPVTIVRKSGLAR